MGWSMGERGRQLTRRDVIGMVGVSALAAATVQPARPARARQADAALRVSGVSSGHDAVGALWYYGLVENAGADPVQDVNVSVGLLNAAGATLAETSAPALLRILAPGD